VYTPADEPALDAGKGDRWFQVVDAQTHQILKRIDMGQKLEEAGYPDMSSAVRPMAITPDEKRVFLQVSFFHGFVEYDLESDRVVRVVNLPISEEAQRLGREEYLLDSAHHGIAINPQGSKLCVAGTMSDYGAIVSTSTFAHRIAAQGKKPYWSTNSGDGRYCFVSFSGDDRVSVVSYAQEREIASIPVGDHPQRMRIGRVRCEYLGPRVDCTAPSVSGMRLVRTRRGRRLRVRLSEAASLRIRVRRVGRAVAARVVRRRVRAGTNRVRVGRLRRGARYRVEITATDEAGNASEPRVARMRAR
jgi:YVTN family beta-propeller protein